MMLKASHGNPAYDKIMIALAMKGIEVGSETIRNYHIGRVDPHVGAIEVLAALADFYDVGLSEISEVAFTRLRNSSDLLVRTLRCIAA